MQTLLPDLGGGCLRWDGRLPGTIWYTGSVVSLQPVVCGMQMKLYPLLILQCMQLLSVSKAVLTWTSRTKTRVNDRTCTFLLPEAENDTNFGPHPCFPKDLSTSYMYTK